MIVGIVEQATGKGDAQKMLKVLKVQAGTSR
jgi:hypothetical protein